MRLLFLLGLSTLIFGFSSPLDACENLAIPNTKMRVEFVEVNRGYKVVVKEDGLFGKTHEITKNGEEIYGCRKPWFVLNDRVYINTTKTADRPYIIEFNPQTKTRSQFHFTFDRKSYVRDFRVLKTGNVVARVSVLTADGKDYDSHLAYLKRNSGQQIRLADSLGLFFKLSPYEISNDETFMVFETKNSQLHSFIFADESTYDIAPNNGFAEKDWGTLKIQIQNSTGQILYLRKINKDHAELSVANPDGRQVQVLNSTVLLDHICDELDTVAAVVCYAQPEVNYLSCANGPTVTYFSLSGRKAGIIKHDLKNMQSTVIRPPSRQTTWISHLEKACK